MKIKSWAAAVKAAAAKLWKAEPARVTAGVTAAVIVAAAAFGIVLPRAGVVEVLALVLPVVLGGEVIRANVTPTR